MVLENFNGVMDHAITVIIFLDSEVEQENLFSIMETIIMEVGLRANRMDKELFLTKMARLFIKVYGKKASLSDLQINKIDFLICFNFTK